MHVEDLSVREICQMNGRAKEFIDNTIDERDWWQTRVKMIQEERENAVEQLERERTECDFLRRDNDLLRQRQTEVYRDLRDTEDAVRYQKGRGDELQGRLEALQCAYEEVLREAKSRPNPQGSSSVTLLCSPAPSVS